MTLSFVIEREIKVYAARVVRGGVCVGRGVGLGLQ
jgi:hypothetical protein